MRAFKASVFLLEDGALYAEGIGMEVDDEQWTVLLGKRF